MLDARHANLPLAFVVYGCYAGNLEPSKALALGPKQSFRKLCCVHPGWSPIPKSDEVPRATCAGARKAAEPPKVADVLDEKRLDFE